MTVERIEIPAIEPDRVYRSADGNHYRVRLARVDAQSIKAAPNIDVALVAPTDIVLSVSIAVVDESGYVQKIGEKLRIADRREIGPLTAAAMADLPALIDTTIAAMIDDADQALAPQPQTLAYLEQAWGISMEAAAPPAPPVFLNLPVPGADPVAGDGTEPPAAMPLSDLPPPPPPMPPTVMPEAEPVLAFTETAGIVENDVEGISPLFVDGETGG